ncbi:MULTISPECIES: diaminobutyrate acetyltransferase [Mycolicibacterium]|uniref:diaminobutyrate acetyltransferase n=1 Tax=Mycolicibacterium TaxID=1866885 RepID=UPI000FA16846|nr:MULTISPECIES: diaminobutyrate acetyltransferase [Mycolicibacterium]RUP34334.1 MAG: diaminobutyrate acetyltransferase [Mycolicibacterium sp.]UCZ63328.1 diaminobutyrate acetyltransferase [Mycolicibacterium phocaicum]
MHEINHAYRRADTAHLRMPRGEDAIAIRDIAAATGVLDVNSTYAYLLWTTDFAASSIVAESTSGICGFITGYHPPQRPNVLFVWQVAVAGDMQGQGLATAMLDALVSRIRSERRGHPITMETTVTPGNTASRKLFGAFARRHGVTLAERPHFSAALLDADGGHEDEPMLRIGPFAAPSSS